jgi:glycosyltransferase involved in cell wall biosynthesis
MAAQALAADHEVSFAFSADAIGDRVPVRKYRMRFRGFTDLATVREIHRVVRRERVQVLIPTKKTEYVLAGIAARLGGAANVLRLGIVRDLRNKFHNDVIYNRLADGIIVNARPIKDKLMRSRFMRNDRIRVIYNGLDTDRLDAALEAPAQGIGRFAFTVTTMGRLTKVKGVDVLIRAFAGFLSETGSPDAELQIIGDGEESGALQSLCSALGIADRVRFTGFLSDPYPCLRETDVFVLASSNEGIANAMLEAMYLGSALVAAGSGGIADVVSSGENGLLFDFGDEAMLTAHLRTLYKNAALRERIARAGRAAVIERFSVNRMRDEVVRFCSEVLSRKQPGRKSR